MIQIATSFLKNRKALRVPHQHHMKTQIFLHLLKNVSNYVECLLCKCLFETQVLVIDICHHSLWQYLMLFVPLNRKENLAIYKLTILLKVTQLVAELRFKLRFQGFWSNYGVWHLVPSLHGKQMQKQWKQCQTLFLWAPKSLQMVIAP